MYSHELRNACANVLSEGRARLSLSMGIVSHIKNDTYEVVAIDADIPVFVPGEVFPLNDTYCREVYEKGTTVALTELAGVPGLQKHPLYEGLPLEAYISTPIFKNEAVWGTFNFSCMKLKHEKFTDEDISYIEALAKLLSATLVNEA